MKLPQFLTKHHAVKVFGREKDSSTPQPVHPRGKIKKVPIANEAAWTPELVWVLFKRERSVAPAGNRNMIPQVVQPVTQPLYPLLARVNAVHIFPTYPESPPKRNLIELGIVFAFSPAIVTNVICDFPLRPHQPLTQHIRRPLPHWHATFCPTAVLVSCSTAITNMCPHFRHRK